MGEATLTPYLRERLKDKSEGLGIDLDFSIDPLTIVAQGAAIFAGTQQMKELLRTGPEAGMYRVELEYKPVGPDIDTLIGGRDDAENSLAWPALVAEAESQTKFDTRSGPATR